MRKRIAVPRTTRSASCGGLIASATALGACGDDTSSSIGAKTDAATDSRSVEESDAPTLDTPEASDLSSKFKNPTQIRYTQQPFQHPFGVAGCMAYSSVRVDLSAKSMMVATCADAGGATDGGASEHSVVLSDADVTALTSLVEALREDTAAADAGCKGFDGTSHELQIARAGGELNVRHEYVCSGPPPDIRVDRAGFLALREKLHILGGLDPNVPAI